MRLLKKVIYSLFVLSILAFVGLFGLYSSKVSEVNATGGHTHWGEPELIEESNCEVACGEQEGTQTLTYQQTCEWGGEGKECEINFVCPEGYSQHPILPNKCWKALTQPPFIDLENKIQVPQTQTYEEVGKCRIPEEEVVSCDQPQPSPTPEQPRETTPASAPVCPNGVPLSVPTNSHVIRNGSDATVNAHILEGDHANIYFKEVGATNWQHSARDIPVTGKYLSYTVHDLNPALGYSFGIQAANGCAGGETVLAVIVDPPAQGVIFPFSYWEWVR